MRQAVAPIVPTKPQRRRYARRLPPEERREQLLDAALDIMVQTGVESVSMESVARRAGVTKPVVYGIFADRGDLLFALLEREEERAYAQLAEALPVDFDRATDPDQLIYEGVLVFLNAVAEHPSRWRLILLPGVGVPTVMQDRVETGRRSVEQRLTLFCRWGLEVRGGASRGMDPELVAHALMALCEHGAALVLRDRECFSPERLASFAQELLAAVPRA
jgi:AcrR family transcriptional regulator